MKRTAHDNRYYSDILRTAGYRATPARITILRTIDTTHSPLSVLQLSQKVDTIDQATLYRAMEAFEKSGLVTKVLLRDNKAYYESKLHDDHHHHLICQKCEVVEDIESCSAEKLEKQILKNSKKFRNITNHSLEFFGLCTKCAK